MSITAAENSPVAWWREPTREQWHAWLAAWLGWTLDAFDFTILSDRGAGDGVWVLLSGARRPAIFRSAHQGAIWGGFASPVVTYFALNRHLGFAIPMAVGTIGGLVSLLLALSVSPETHGKELVADVVLA
jgi:hypothetical protein